MEIITKRIADTIEDSDITIKEIAKKLGCSTKQITRWKKGEAEMGIYKLKIFCEILDVSADYIVGITDNPKSKK
ncbi:MAG: helix-turn-helix transcriptional regulator [Clostridia bacterium]|nr:helix-turn-helix transcriptional regulator [Clostridia bacterium]